FNIGISIFVFLLSGIMIFSQILFIIYAMFLPISFLLSMIPTFENMGKQAIMKLFNVIMLRAGITLIITVAFSISSMLYSLTTSYPFFLIAFLQIVTFAGIYMKLGDIMSMFSLQSNDSQNVGRKVMRRPYRMFNRGGRRLQRNITRTLAGATAGVTDGALVGQSKKTKGSSSPLRPLQRLTSSLKKNREKTNEQTNQTSLSQKFGQVTGKVLGAKNQVRANVKHRKEQLVDLPTSTKYAVMQGREQLKKPVHDFKEGVVQATEQRQKTAKERTVNHRQTIADKRRVFDKKRASSLEQATHTRPVTQREPIVGRIIQQQKTSSNEQEQLTHGMQNHINQSQVQRKRTTSKERPEMERKQKVKQEVKHRDKPIKVMKKRQLQKRSAPMNRRERQ